MKPICKRKLAPPEKRPFNSIAISVVPTLSNGSVLNQHKRFSREVAPVNIWLSHYYNQGTVGVYCGKVSSNTEVIRIINDVDGNLLNTYQRLIPNDLYSRLLIQKTPQNEYNIIYRCFGVEIERSHDLAFGEDNQPIISTIGTGKYFTTNKLDYKTIQGTKNPVLLAFNIPEVSPDEREYLLEAAISLSACPMTGRYPVSRTENNTYVQPLTTNGSC